MRVPDELSNVRLNLYGGTRNPDTMMSEVAESPTDTRERILDAAESLFIENGFAATSVRAIATEAEVNLAATNYHFGTKKGLFAAVFHRRVEPINQDRLRRLAELQQEAQVCKRQLTIRSILEAFFTPLIDAVSDPKVPALIGRMLGEPESLSRPVAEAEFQEVASAYLNVLATILPAVPFEELRWRFHFMIGSMIHLLQMHAPLGSESTFESFTQGLPRLIDWAIAGLEQNHNGKSYG